MENSGQCGRRWGLGDSEDVLVLDLHRMRAAFEIQSVKMGEASDERWATAAAQERRAALLCNGLRGQRRWSGGVVLAGSRYGDVWRGRSDDAGSAAGEEISQRREGKG